MDSTSIAATSTPKRATGAVAMTAVEPSTKTAAVWMRA